MKKILAFCFIASSCFAANPVGNWHSVVDKKNKIEVFINFQKDGKYQQYISSQGEFISVELGTYRKPANGDLQLRPRQAKRCKATAVSISSYTKNGLSMNLDIQGTQYKAEASLASEKATKRLNNLPRCL